MKTEKIGDLEYIGVDEDTLGLMRDIVTQNTTILELNSKIIDTLLTLTGTVMFEDTQPDREAVIKIMDQANDNRMKR